MRVVAVLLSGFMLLSAEALVDPGELACEDAVKHLLDCCGSDDVAVRNVTCYAERGCGMSTPQLDPSLSTCFRDASCADVIASGACANPTTATCTP